MVYRGKVYRALATRPGFVVHHECVEVPVGGVVAVAHDADHFKFPGVPCCEFLDEDPLGDVAVVGHSVPL